MVWVPKRYNGLCYKKSNRCQDPEILDANSSVLNRWPDMEGAFSAYKHYSQEENFSIYSTFDINLKKDEPTGVIWGGNEITVGGKNQYF